MITCKLVRGLGAFGMALAFIATPSQSLVAKGSDGGGSTTKMVASIAGVKAIAKYEERGTSRRKFNFQLELGTPGQVGTVTATAANGSRVTMGTFTVDSLRRGIIDIDTSEGNVVPDLNSGSTITLQMNGRSFSGVLR